MHTYIVTGIIQCCIHSRWTEGGIRIDVRAESHGDAINRVLGQCRQAAEQHDAYATVRWHSTEMVRSEQRGEA